MDMNEIPTCGKTKGAQNEAFKRMMITDNSMPLVADAANKSLNHSSFKRASSQRSCVLRIRSSVDVCGCLQSAGF